MPRSCIACIRCLFFDSPGHTNRRNSEPSSSLRRKLPLILCALTVTDADAGHLIRGRVTDAASDALLAAATVQVVGTYRGTIANDNGTTYSS